MQKDSAEAKTAGQEGPGWPLQQRNCGIFTDGSRTPGVGRCSRFKKLGDDFLKRRLGAISAQGTAAQQGSKVSDKGGRYPSLQMDNQEWGGGNRYGGEWF